MKPTSLRRILTGGALATLASPAFADVLESLEAAIQTASWPLWLGAGSALLLVVALAMNARSGANQSPEVIRPRFGEMTLRDDAP